MDKRKAAKRRLFRIWQHLGHNPFVKREQNLPLIKCSSCGQEYYTPYCPYCGQARGVQKGFFSQSFDSVPFLNDDAKNTFLHLLLRPGYMMRDYLHGQSSRYLAPMTSLIIFYAFLVLMMSVISPSFDIAQDSDRSPISVDYKKSDSMGNVIEDDEESTLIMRTLMNLESIHVLLTLDKNPDAVDTKAKASLAAFESALRSQGITEFLGQLLFLTFSIWVVFARGYGLSFSASATIASYFLCQKCFLKMLVLLITLGKSSSLGLLIWLVVMSIDLKQLFQLGWGKSLLKSVWVSLISGLLYIIMYSAFFGIALLVSR